MERTLLTSQTRVKHVSRIHHRTLLWLTRLTLVCEVIRYRLLQVRQNLKKKKRLFGLAARNRLSLSLPLSFSPSSYFLSFSIQKNTTLATRIFRFFETLCNLRQNRYRSDPSSNLMLEQVTGRPTQYRWTSPCYLTESRNHGKWQRF